MRPILLSWALLLSFMPAIFGQEPEALKPQDAPDQRMAAVEKRLDALSKIVLDLVLGKKTNLEKERDGLRRENRKLSEMLQKSLADVRTLRERILKAELERKANEKEVMELKARVAELEKKRATPAAPESLPTPPPPSITGKIVGLSVQHNLLVINLGPDDGVSVGSVFAVQREGFRLGTLVINKVYVGKSAGNLREKEEISRIRIGDRVVSVSGVDEAQTDTIEFAPQGRILRADADHGFAYINLGWNHGLKPGEEFRVYRVEPSAQKTYLGRLRVVRTEKDFSQCTILIQENGDKPIQVGDRIWSPDFVKKKERSFVLLGVFDPSLHGYTKAELTALLRVRGHLVFESVNKDTNYAVLGDQAPADPRWGRVLSLGVKRITIDGLLRLIEIPRRR